ncbi:YecR family lipoprotein [Xanthomonas nasturtii]|uniref:YecR family lipoprotein n=1 Tax=Xanthomonas nasturtii TaxID=1843581 RepID=UPI003CCE8C09
MKGKKLVGMLAVSAVLAGCATQKDLMVTGASRSDGVVTLSYESNEFQRVSYDAQRAQEAAAQRCVAWGYSGAEAFGSEQTTCTSRRGFGNCGSRRVDVQYQCTGSPGGR